MDGNIVSFSKLAAQVLRGEITEDQVVDLYGASTLRRIYDAHRELHYGEAANV